MAFKVLSNRGAMCKILEALGLDDTHVSSIAINGKEIINLDNMNEAIEVKVSKMVIDDE